jgi:WhiB family redox-sensing transcriptional regulator
MLTIFYLSGSKVPACAGMDPGLFVGPDGEERADREAREIEAKSVCRSCPLISECFAHALDNREFGVWGATNEDDRKAIRTGRAARRDDGLTIAQAAKAERQNAAWALHLEGVTVPEIAKRVGVATDTAYEYVRSQRRVIEHEQADREAEASTPPKAVPYGSPNSVRKTTPVLITSGVL